MPPALQLAHTLRHDADRPSDVNERARNFPRAYMALAHAPFLRVSIYNFLERPIRRRGDARYVSLSTIPPNRYKQRPIHYSRKSRLTSLCACISARKMDWRSTRRKKLFSFVPAVYIHAGPKLSFTVHYSWRPRSSGAWLLIVIDFPRRGCDQPRLSRL